MATNNPTNNPTPNRTAIKILRRSNTSFSPQLPHPSFILEPTPPQIIQLQTPLQTPPPSPIISPTPTDPLPLNCPPLNSHLQRRTRPPFPPPINPPIPVIRLHHH